MNKPTAENKANGSTRNYPAGAQALGNGQRSGEWPGIPPEGGKHKQFGAQDILYHESDQVYSVYVIKAGLVKLLSYLPNGRARIVRLHSAGDVLGLEGLLGQSYEHTAVAVGDVEVEHYPVHSLQRLHEQDPHALGQLLCHWHGHLIQADRWIADFSTGEIKPRVARLLRFLAELEYGEATDRVALLRVHEMADILGVTQESVSRILAVFKRSEILQKRNDADPGDIYWFDNEKLQQEALQ